ncbi:unnamed protein product, partial [Rotaria sp. Silwood2]
MLKFIRHNQTILYFLRKTIYHNELFNSQYIVNNEHESLIFAVGTE